uniref:Putative ovule protein n=1 Tax=Solanum chacoense TaxID=4108 RepID=A0A0V0GTB4_SOLCH
MILQVAGRTSHLRKIYLNFKPDKDMFETTEMINFALHYLKWDNFVCHFVFAKFGPVMMYQINQFLSVQSFFSFFSCGKRRGGGCCRDVLLLYILRVCICIILT